MARDEASLASMSQLAACQKAAARVGGRAWEVLSLSVRKYVDTDGELRAASFAYYAFFALFPLLLLFISIGSWIWRGQEAEVSTRIFRLLENDLPIPPAGKELIVSTISGLSSGTASLVAVLALTWSALRFFQALVQGVNRAWGLEGYSWWRLPIANLLMVAITASTLLLGVVAPVVMRMVENFWRAHGGFTVELVITSFRYARLVLPSLILFYGLLMFYKYAPQRKTKFSEVWSSALLATIGLQVVSKGMVIYADNFARFNKLYGTLGSVVAVLMWIYLSGSVIIFCGCFGAAQAEAKARRASKA